MAHGGGPKLQLTDELRAKIVDLVRRGNYREPSAVACGVKIGTWRKWMQRGNKDTKGVYYELSQALRQAEQEAHTEMVIEVLRQGMADAKHIRWWLGRKFSNYWADDKDAIKELIRRVDALTKALEAAGVLPPNSTPPPEQIDRIRGAEESAE